MIEELHENDSYKQCVKDHGFCLERLKNWRVKSHKLDSQIFMETELVEREKTYRVDEDGYNLYKDIQRKQYAGDSSPNSRMSKRQSIIGGKSGS